MFLELFEMPMAYDMGIDIRENRSRKPCRKGAKNKKHKSKETIIMTSKEVAGLSGELLSIMLAGRP